MLSKEDIIQIADKGISKDSVLSQLRRFREGFPSLKIASPALINDGILRLADQEITEFISIYESSTVDKIKFVPASGAASRMFKMLYKLLESYDSTEHTIDSIDEDLSLSQFFQKLDQFAFYDELASKYKENSGCSIEEAVSQKKHVEIIDCLLNENGLNYGNLPKGLLTFHRYPIAIRTAANEQLVEGLAYALKNDEVNIHFTVSPDHLSRFEDHISTLANEIDLKVNATYSVQKEKTDTVASTLDFKPFKINGNNLLFRPAGHGALLENLNDLDADLVFIKNIDNVVPDRLKETTIRYKKALAGVLLSYQDIAFKLLRRADQGDDVHTEVVELLSRMGTKGVFSSEEAIKLLNRPIRVCGMVKNQGEPGGGPFWVETASYKSLQIVESAQVNIDNKEQQKVFKSGTHFNPVDLICGLKNYRGGKFDLLKHRDENAGFISEKSYGGEKLLAMELPGLWNGSMAYWNTIFVEVPLETFNPVKTVLDLLKPNHL